MGRRDCWKNFCLGLFLALTPSSGSKTTIVRPRRCHGEAKHIHLSVGRDPSTEMTISFATTWSYPGVEAPLGGLHLGLHPDKLDRFIEEQEFPISYDTTQYKPEWGGYSSPFQHHISVDGLKPNTTYYYVVSVPHPNLH